MIINIHGARCSGIDAVPVTVEVDITQGIGIHLVGLADVAVKESLLRTVTALQALGFRVPGKKIVINLAPADVHKRGSGYDLPIALGIIAASGQRLLPALEDYLIMGELGLDGSVRDVQGALPFADLARNMGLKGCILPVRSALETIECSNLEIYGVEMLTDALRILGGEPCEDLSIWNTKTYRRVMASLAPKSGAAKVESAEEAASTVPSGQGNGLDSGQGTKDRWLNIHRCNPTNGDVMDFSEIMGQEGAKRGLEVAASGGHNVILVGPQGCGKSSLAKALTGILPPMTTEEAIVTSKIYSVAGMKDSSIGLIRARPFRSPHYSASMAAVLGGGAGGDIKPGEVTLAQNGVLFLDEYGQVPKQILESLRAPLEDRKITISRLHSKVEFPASFMLVAASNPCPCGYYGDGDRCTCTPSQRQTYLSKLSGPLMDRIDIQIYMHSVDPLKLVGRKKEESSSSVAERVSKAREVQRARFEDEGIFTNAEMNNRLIEKFCPLDEACTSVMEKMIAKLGLSARAYSRILKVARTIADLASSPDIRPEHIREASSYRFLDRQL